MTLKLQIVLICFLSPLIKAQTVANVNCNFVLSGNTYSCQIAGTTVSDDENVLFIIGGVHLQGQTNADVERIEVMVSNIPFIIVQLLTTFPNVHTFSLSSSGLTRIQSNAFSNGTNLRSISITFNPLTTIAANAFFGASNLEFLDLLGNQLEFIHELAFNGLTSLQQIFGDHNRLQVLHHNVFRTLISLDSLYLANNQLESLDGRLLSNNNNMRRLDIARNQINAIGRNFLDGIPSLSSFNTVGNRCTNSFWTIGGVTTIETVRLALAPCFDNFVEPPEDDVKIFTLELRGSLILRLENGTEIIRL